MLSWAIREVDSEAVGMLVAEIGVSEVTARCLAGRGVSTAAEARAFLSPRLAALRPPGNLAGLDRAVDRLASAVRAGEHIGCFGDYDADGVTTTALLAGYLRGLGARCTPKVARRDRGYGLGVADVDELASCGCELLVVGDCGTSDLEAIGSARDRGIDVIVLDHHTVPPADSETPHPAYALVNPHRADSSFPFRDLASVGLGFYAMAALRTSLAASGEIDPADPAHDPRALLDLVALGTVADQVRLTRENRILTSVGMRYLERRMRPGIAALLSRAGVGEGQTVDEHTISWKLAPRLNAPGRLGEAEPALELLLASERRAAEALAGALEQANDLRRQAQANVVEEAAARVGESDPRPAVVVAGRGWPKGVVGVVAARLVDRYRCPAFVIAVDPETGVGVGSARSVAGVNLYDLLSQCAPLLVRFGGHAGAAGFTVAEDRIDGLRSALRRAARETLPSEPAEQRADAEVDLADVDRRLAEELTRLAPFGRGNEQPVLVSRGLRVRQSRRVGDGSHLKLQLEGDGGAKRSGIGFGLGDSDPGVGATVDAAFSPVVSQWGGTPHVELQIRALAPTSVEKPGESG